MLRIVVIISILMAEDDTMEATQTLEGLIVRNPELRGGRPIIAGTGVTVRTIVGHYKLGLTAEEIADEMNLELAGVYAALAYYHLNRNEIEADIKTNAEQAVMEEFFDG
jgi:uncharacterized protein (DUF433 family)